MFLIAARVEVKPECRQAFVEASKAIIAGTRAEGGCISYALHEDVHQPGRFLFYEEWQSAKAIETHFQEPHFVAFGEAIADLVASPPQISVHEVVASDLAG